MTTETTTSDLASLSLEGIRDELVRLDGARRDLNDVMYQADQRAAGAFTARDAVAAANAWSERDTARARLELAEAERERLFSMMLSGARAELEAWQSEAETILAGWTSETETRRKKVKALMAALGKAVEEALAPMPERQEQRAVHEGRLQGILERIRPFEGDVVRPEFPAMPPAVERASVARDLIALANAIDPMVMAEGYSEAVFKSPFAPYRMIVLQDGTKCQFADGEFRTSDARIARAVAAVKEYGVVVAHMPRSFTLTQ